MARNSSKRNDDRNNLINFVIALMQLAEQQENLKDSDVVPVKATWLTTTELEVTGRHKQRNRNSEKIVEKGASKENLAQLIFNTTNTKEAKKNDKIQTVLDNLRWLDQERNQLFIDNRPKNEKGKTITNAPYWKFTLILESQDIEQNSQFLQQRWDELKLTGNKSPETSPNSTLSTKNKNTESLNLGNNSTFYGSITSINTIKYPPLPDEKFVGRIDEINKYINQLKNAATRVIIPGIAGVGKTALARKLLSELILSHEFSQEKILWAEFDEEDSIQGWWARLSKIAKEKGNETTAIILNDKNNINKVKIEELANFLDEEITTFFIDNYHKILKNIEFKNIVEKIIDRCIKTKFVIISRRYLKRYLADELEGLNSEFGIQLLRNCNSRLQNVDDKLLGEVVEKCRGHALAIRIVSGISKQRTIRDILKNFPIWDEELRGLFHSLFAEMTNKERDFAVTVSCLKSSVSFSFIEHLYPEYNKYKAQLNKSIQQIQDLFLIESNFFLQQTLGNKESITLVNMHDLIVEYCQTLVLDPEESLQFGIGNVEQYHQRAAQAWISILPPLIQVLFEQAQEGNFSFLPEETSGQKVDNFLLLPNEINPNLNQLGCIAQAYYHSFESKNFQQSSALLFLIDRYLYRWDMIPQLLDQITELERNNAQLAPQLIIRKARILKEQGKAEEVIEIAQSLQKNQHDLEVMAVADSQIGHAKMVLKDYEEAIENYQLALTKHISIDNKKGISATYGNIGEAYFELKNYEEALKNYEKAYQITEDPHFRSRNLWRIGRVYLKQKKYPVAIEKLDKSQNQMKKIEQEELLKASVDLARVRLDLAKALIEIGNTSKAKCYLELAKDTFERQELKNFKDEAEKRLNNIQANNEFN